MPVYRIPPYKIGPEMMLANDGSDRMPWSLTTCRVPEHWKDTKGKGILVAVLDTGLWRHRDLPDPVFAANFSSSGTVYDRQGHGTHVAGTIGARLDGTGVVGWAPECSLGCVKVLGDDGSGDDEGIARGIDYAAQAGAHVINMSLGGGFSQMIADACRRAVARGVFMICAAGNEGLEGGQNTVGWPARLDEVIAIASFRRDGRISDFSSYGPEVDMAFPGEDILSTWPNNTFRTLSGTSMATPAACGLTALMLAYQADQEKAGKRLEFPIKNNLGLIDHWKRHAVDAGDPGQDIRFGWGVPDVSGIIRGGLIDPPPVTPPVVTPPAPPPTPPTPPTDPGLSLPGGFMISAITYQGKAGLFIYHQ